MIPEDWELPLVADLPPKARACAEQWTQASYETHGEAFLSYWRSERKMKADWRGTWANRVISLHSQVMRDQKFGNAPTDTVAKVDRDASWYETQARFFDKIGKPHDAEECRRKAVSIGAVVRTLRPENRVSA